MSILSALGAAVLFGLSTPLARQWVQDMSAWYLAGLLYLGSALGLMGLMGLCSWQGRSGFQVALSGREWPCLAGAIACGGVAGPVLLMLGLAQMGAAQASLLLNLEGVLTALVVWVVFKENTDRRMVLGMALIVAGAFVLSWPTTAPIGGTGTSITSITGITGSWLIAAACLCWALDNNLTRQVAHADAKVIAGIKGGCAAVVNLALAQVLGHNAPSWTAASCVMLIGFAGYGISLVLFVVALRGLGAARTGAYFGIAPFVGALVAILVFGESPTPLFWTAGLLMGIGVWLHLTEHHAHSHQHTLLHHNHPHRHDEHHLHSHPADTVPGTFQTPPNATHTHPHTHAPLCHSHPHYPDIHHRHEHS